VQHAVCHCQFLSYPQLENREVTANEGYMELKELKEVAATRYLKEYKEQGEERRRGKIKRELDQGLVRHLCCKLTFFYFFCGGCV
jgi:hypothetical protein